MCCTSNMSAVEENLVHWAKARWAYILIVPLKLMFGKRDQLEFGS